MSPKLFLAFMAVSPNSDGFNARLQRAILGPVEHVEFVVRDGKYVMRYMVSLPNKHHDACVFKTKLAYDTVSRWTFMRLLLEEFKVVSIIAFLEDAIAKRHYFTNTRMIQAIGITLPSCFWAVVMGPDCAVDNPGNPIYCTELCMLALQHVGLLAYYPADMCTPNDLMLMVKEITEVTDACPTTVDAGAGESSYLA
jgi:hypothetical protein